jgi:hypothetical protein
MNKVILLGRLTKDPEVRWTQGEHNTAIARYTLAVDRRFKKDGEQSADFISCVAFGKTGEAGCYSSGKRPIGRKVGRPEGQKANRLEGQ